MNAGLMRRLLFLAFLSACSGSGSVEPPPDEGLPGYWKATHINGQPLPAPALYHEGLVTALNLRFTLFHRFSTISECVLGSTGPSRSGETILWGGEGDIIYLNYSERNIYIPDTILPSDALTWREAGIPGNVLIWHRANGFGTAQGFDTYRLERVKSEDFTEDRTTRGLPQ